MTQRSPALERRALPVELDRHEIARRARVPGAGLALFETGPSDAGWLHGPCVALAPRPVRLGHDRERALARLDALVAGRSGAGDGTGVLVAVAFDEPRSGSRESTLLAWAVDEVVTWDEGATPTLVVRSADASTALRSADRWQRRLDTPARPAPALRAVGLPITSLPRAAYRRAVERVRASIAAGEVYQANVCQRFRVPAEGDPFELFVALARAAAGPRSAYLEWDGSALVSVSPELFLCGRLDGMIETRPIKGTRRRGVDDEDDRRQLDTLVASDKDHAELLMIVDLERNDLSRICEPGTVRVPELAVARSYATVHHLEARVEGRLQPGIGPGALLRATFPGGSISGAPKIRALELLRAIEPAPRRFFTGSLIWFGDDGAFDSSILIRTLEYRDGAVEIGAGGGVTWGSDPDAEWRESNDKARALTRAVGFEPEIAG